MRLIDADAVIDKYCAVKRQMQMMDNTQYADAVIGGMRKIVRMIEEQPTIENKYRWHDLRKNSEDLPEPHSLCIICVKRWSKIIDDWIIGDYKLTEFIDGFEYAKGWHGLPEPEVLAWKYIEPFEEDEP